MRCLNRLRIIRQAAAGIPGAEQFRARFDMIEHALTAMSQLTRVLNSRDLRQPYDQQPGSVTGSTGYMLRLAHESCLPRRHLTGARWVRTPRQCHERN
jgi:hypothetical protein